jgi:hypothetical protein
MMSATAAIGDTAPASQPGLLWFDSTSLQLYVRYADADSTQWVPATNVAALSGDMPFLPLSGGDITGRLGITGARTWNDPTFPGHNPAFYESVTYTGTPVRTVNTFPGPEGYSVPLNLFSISEALVADTMVNGLEIQHNTTGGDGSRHGLLVAHQILGPMGASAPNFVAAQLFQIYASNVTGAAAGTGNGRGDVFGLGINMQVGDGSFLHGFTGIELDIAPHAGSSVDYLVGMQIVNFGVAGVTANVFDAMHMLCTVDPSVNKRSTYGLYFGSPQAADAKGFPITAAGSMLSSVAGICSYGIDFSAVTFTGAFLKGPNGFAVDNNNNVHTDRVIAPSNTFAVLDSGGAPAFVAGRGSVGAVNYLSTVSGAPGTGVFLVATGTDANVPLYIKTVGAGGFYFLNGDNNRNFFITGVANSVNYVKTTGATTGNSPLLTAEGSDANVNLTLSGQGTGAVKVASKLNLSSIPTSATGLVAGDVWRNGTTLNIV